MATSHMATGVYAVQFTSQCKPIAIQPAQAARACAATLRLAHYRASLSEARA
ncbi:hypothetical protein [Erythrobacter donghaensis]|uniref:hypothetical protein n=1 Tax=Erythrobacter donghaensis TaxID=267135 RepID=UPI001B807A47|nr:hypothetical protein [Erythrobacter donghaensis]